MPVLAAGTTIKPVLALLFEVITIVFSFRTRNIRRMHFYLSSFLFFIPELFDLTTSDFFSSTEEKQISSANEVTN